MTESCRRFDALIARTAHDEIDRIVRSRDPWTLSNGGLVPAP